jgi:Ca2+-binding EF-hand superfamily protein
MKVIKEETQDVKKTFVTFLLDDSGSMRGVVNETILGFNDQLRAVQKMEEEPNHEVYVSFVSFL